MSKFVVGYEEDVLVITENLADAEEYLLSEVEANAYENFLYGINYYGYSIDEEVEYVSDNYKSRQFRTFYGLYLSNCHSGYWISEVSVLN